MEDGRQFLPAGASLMDSVNVYVLSELAIDGKGGVVSHNVGVTFDIRDAKAQRGADVANDFETFSVAADWSEGQ